LAKTKLDNISLRGKDGREVYEVDALGQIVRVLGRFEPTAGNNLKLTLDGRLQQAAAREMEGKKGAVIATNPANGEILALFSSPSFDPNRFSLGMSQEEYQSLAGSPDQPLFDRAIGGVYPPGSTFKIVMALAGLEEGAIKPDTVVEDTGVLTIGPFSFPNWYYAQYGKTEGPVDIVKAIQRSNDIFFYKVGEWLGITKIADWSRRAGIGKPLGIELSGEAGGLVPDPAWKAGHFTSPADLTARNNLWYLGDTYHVSIGQGYLLTTPLQMNAWTNIIANGGKLCRPTIAKATSDKRSFNKTQDRQGTSNCKDLGIKPETIKLITEGMQKACQTGGTGWPLFNFQVSKFDKPVPSTIEGLVKLDQLSSDKSTTHSGERVSVTVACKTGTAEYGDQQNKTHAWFTAFAPLPKDYLGVTFKGETLQGVDSNQIITNFYMMI